MSHTVQLDTQSLGLIPGISHGKTETTLRASLEKLEELLELVSEVEASKGDTSKSIAADVTSRLKPVLEAYAKQDPEAAEKVMRDLAPLLAGYAKGNPEATGEILKAITPAVRSYILAHPDDLTGAIRLVAPLVQETSGGVASQVQFARSVIGNYEKSVKGVDSKTFDRVFLSEVAPRFAHAADSASALENLYKEIRPLLETLHAEDPSKMGPFLTHLEPVLGLIAMRSPKKAHEVLATLTLQPFYHEPEALLSLQDDMKKLHVGGSAHTFLAAYAASGTSSSPKIGEELATAMLFLQKFQVALSQAQASQDAITTKIGETMIQAAQSMQQEIQNKVAEANAEQAAASAPKPWWQWLIIVVVTVVSIVVAAMTAGLGAALVALIVGSFMSSPLFNMTVHAISKGIESDLQKKYESEGMSRADAKEKATAVADIIAKVIVVVAVMVISAGVGGIGAASEGSATSATEDTGIEMTNMGGEEGAEDAGEAEETGTSNSSQSSRASAMRSALVNGGKLAVVQGISTLSASNIWMDAMMTNPEWVRKHETAALIIDIIAEVVCLAASLYAGAKMMPTTEGTGSTLMETLSAKFGTFMRSAWILKLGSLAQAGSSGVSAYMAGRSATYLHDSAETMELIGELEAKLTENQTGLQFQSETENINDTSALNITKSNSQEMAALEQAADRVWDTTSRVLRR